MATETKPEQRAVHKLDHPEAAADALRLARGLAKAASWSAIMAARGLPQGPLAFSRRFVQRFDIDNAPGARAADFARELLPRSLDIGEFEMTVSPYAPPMRQLSSVRQGVPMWSGASKAVRPAPEPIAARHHSTAGTDGPAGCTARHADQACRRQR